MTDSSPRQESPAQSLHQIEKPTIKVTHENLDEALRVLRIVLDEEKETTQ